VCQRANTISAECSAAEIAEMSELPVEQVRRILAFAAVSSR
jgi:hypothetical protein